MVPTVIIFKVFPSSTKTLEITKFSRSRFFSPDAIVRPLLRSLYRTRLISFLSLNLRILEAVDAFFEKTQLDVNGVVRISLHKGNAIVNGRTSSANSLYMPQMATYGLDDQFDHKAAKGFIYIWGLPSRVWSAIKGQKKINSN